MNTRRPTQLHREFLYFLPLIFPGLAIAGWYADRLWLFQVVVWVYLAAPYLDVVIGVDVTSIANPRIKPTLCELGPRAWVVAQPIILLCALLMAHRHEADWQCRLVLATCTGIAGGMFGITAAHELLHSSRRIDRQLAETLLTTLHYPHFAIEHVYGHHVRVGTPADPASARLGESFYAFYVRTITGGLQNAWRIERQRVAQSGRGFWIFRNRMLTYGCALFALYMGILGFFGVHGVLLFLIQGIVAFSILEVLNYVTHYGLVRQTVAPNRYEPVGPQHSWNSNHRVTNWLLFNVGRHSDHHCEANRSYSLLRHKCEAPQLPSGLFAMYAMALFPPLWHRIMDGRVMRMQSATGMNRGAA